MPKKAEVKKENVDKKKNKKRIVEEKTSSEQKKKFIDNFIPKSALDITLVITFIVLLIVVIFLGIKAVDVKKEHEKENVDLTIPVLEKTTNNTFSVDLSELEDEEIKEYKFMITNYKDDEICEEDINYQIDLTNNSESVSIKLYKNGEDKNLLTGDETTYTLENNKLSKAKKDSDTYYLIIRVKEEVKEKDNITIKITGIN